MKKNNNKMNSIELISCMIIGLVIGGVAQYMFTIENQIFTDTAAQHQEYVNTLSKE